MFFWQGIIRGERISGADGCISVCADDMTGVVESKHFGKEIGNVIIEGIDFVFFVA